VNTMKKANPTPAGPFAVVFLVLGASARGDAQSVSVGMVPAAPALPTVGDLNAALTTIRSGGCIAQGSFRGVFASISR
jgi:predicted secreted protein